MRKLTKQSLRAMRNRWELDISRLEALAGYGADDVSGRADATSETIRSLATAIAEIDGIITDRLLFPEPTP